MTEHDFLIAISALSREIDLLRFEKENLEKTNRTLAEKLGNIGLEIIRKECENDGL